MHRTHDERHRPRLLRRQRNASRRLRLSLLAQQLPHRRHPQRRHSERSEEPLYLFLLFQLSSPKRICGCTFTSTLKPRHPERSLERFCSKRSRRTPKNSTRHHRSNLSARLLPLPFPVVIAEGDLLLSLPSSISCHPLTSEFHVPLPFVSQTETVSPA